MKILYGNENSGSMLSVSPEEDLKNTYKKRRFEEVEVLLNQKLAPIRGRCIELGSGAGYFSMILSKQKHVSEAIALDISSEDIYKFKPIYQNLLKPDLTKLHYIIDDMNEVKEGYGIFDTVIFCASLHHSRDIFRSLSIANKLLKMHGVVVLHGEHYYPIFFSKKKKSKKLPHTIIDFSKLLKRTCFKPVVFRYALKGRRFPLLKHILFTVSPFKFINGWVWFNSFMMLGIKKEEIKE